MGWDRQVTEFNDVEGREYGDPKKWAKFHTDDITCADVKLGEGVVTATYSGEIIFWKLETGQPYRRYNVMDPSRFIELKLNAEEEKLTRRSKRMSSLIGVNRRSTSVQAVKPDEIKDYGANIPVSVQAVLFLQRRPMTKEHGKLTPQPTSPTFAQHLFLTLSRKRLYLPGYGHHSGLFASSAWRLY